MTTPNALRGRPLSPRRPAALAIEQLVRSIIAQPRRKGAR
jgi:hypothetical protein